MRALLGFLVWHATTMVMAFPDGNTLSYVDPTEVHRDESREIGKKGAMEQCDEIMANNGLNFSSFWHGAAHGLHSISLEEVRHYFEPDAKEENKIPVINTNLSAEQTILFNSPLRGYDEDFKTMALKVMAFFMLNDKPNFYQQGVNTLEKISHQYHMHEIYAAAAPIYRKLKEDPPADLRLCTCVNDATGNGILEEMVKIAKQLKYFGRQGRSRCFHSQTYLGYFGYFGYRGGCGGSLQKQKGRRMQSSENTSEIISKCQEEYLADSSKENAGKLLDIQPWKPNTLVGPDQWISYEAMLTWSMLGEEELNDFAVFMFCKLNHPDLDHAKDLFE